MTTDSQIHIDPLLGEIAELLHRMELCRTNTPIQWMASDALRKLQEYEQKLARVTPRATD